MDRSLTHETHSYAVDPEHSAMRISVIILFFVVWIAGFILFRLIFSFPAADIIAIMAGFGITALSTQRFEQYFKDHWPSGRAVQVNRHAIHLVNKDQIQGKIDPSQQVNALLWHFKIGRRSRVKKGWYVVACALEQDEKYIAIYTFIPPNLFDELKFSQHFTLLQKLDDQNRPGQRSSTPMQLAGEQRRLHVAEKVRWLEGAEMQPEVFQTYLQTLQDSFPQWMPSVI